jgi:uncharacterized protein
VGFLAGLIAFLAAWNNVVNVLPRPGWTYVPVNLGVGVGLVALARRRGFGWRSLGFGRRQAGPGLRWGGGVAAVVGAGLAVAVSVPGLRPLLADDRLAGVGTGEAAYRALFRIPLGTALFEEVAFRGVLLAVWARHRGMREAVIGSSALFGIWHVVPTLHALDANQPDASGVALTAGVAGGVAVTAVAGLGFCFLRLRSDSVLAPFLAHVATNSFATIASVAAARLG